MKDLGYGESWEMVVGTKEGQSKEADDEVRRDASVEVEVEPWIDPTLFRIRSKFQVRPGAEVDNERGAGMC